MDLSTAVDTRELLRTALSKFDAEHDRIVSSSRETALEQSYFKENCYDTTMQTYLGGVTQLNLRIKELSQQVQLVISQSLSRSRTILPHISLPKFSVDPKLYGLRKTHKKECALRPVVDKPEQSNLVYKIPCVCDKCYIGQTKQKLKKRLEQHKNDCKPINA
ncbi:hypothetical protein M0804_013414 [Polistes exclamans]|nr:hypothetical protein M0804_013414 [Polistes exclamans]